MDMAVTPVVVVQDFDLLLQQVEMLDLSQEELKKALLPESINPLKVNFDYLYLINCGQQSVVVGEFGQQWDEYSRRKAYSRSYLQSSADGKWTAKERIWDITPLYIFPKYPLKIASQDYLSKPVKIALQKSPSPAETDYSPGRNTESPPGEPAAVTESFFPETSLLASHAPITDSMVEQKVKTVHAAAGTEKPTDSRSSTKVSVPEGSKPAEPALILVKAEDIETSAMPEQESSIAPVDSEPETTETEKPVGKKYSRSNSKILSFVEKWRLAWESMQIEPYIDCYDKSFVQGNKNRDAWKRYKTSLNKNYKFINVEVADIKVNWTAAGAVVTFHQVYRSDRYFAEGQKTLQLVYDGDSWKIFRESWKKS